MLTSVSYSKVSALILHPSYTERNNLCAAPSESKSWHYFFKVWLAFLRLTFSKLPFVWQVKVDMITRNFLLLLVLTWFKFVLSMKETLVQVWASVVLCDYPFRIPRMDKNLNQRRGKSIIRFGVVFPHVINFSIGQGYGTGHYCQKALNSLISVDYCVANS